MWPTSKSGCPIFATVSSSLRWVLCPGTNANPQRPAVASENLKPLNPPRSPIERKSRTTSRPRTQRPHQSIRKRPSPRLKRNHRSKNLLFVLNDKSICLQHPFNRLSDLPSRQPIYGIQNPYRLHHRDKADKPRLPLRQTPLKNLRSLRRLHRIVLRKIANYNIRIQPDHRRFIRRIRPTAPAAAPASISSTETRRLARTIPFRAEVRTFGKITTLPSGCTKNLIRSPGPR